MVAFATSVEFEVPERVVLPPPPLLVVSVELELELLVVMSLLPDELVVAPEESVELLLAVLTSEPVVPSVVLSPPPLALHSPLEHVYKQIK